MRKRQRHVNPRHAGAVLVLDARYIAQADNTAVSTWSDRSGNGYDFAQATGANQPTLQVGEVGGSSIVRFNGTSTYLSRSDTGFPTGSVTVLGVHNLTTALANNFRVMFHYGQASNGSAIFYMYGENVPWGNEAFGVSQYGNQSTIPNSTLANIVGSFTRVSTTYNIWKNGASKTIKTMQTNTATYGTNGAAVGSMNAGISYGDKFTGDLGFILLANSEWPDSLRRRFESALGYSWKIACS